MKVSVIIPTFNAGHFIAESVQSVLAQSMGDLEVIIVDDGSTDDTQDVLVSLRDPRIKILRFSSNQGIGMSRNEGLRAAKGEFIAFNDADDRWLPDKLEKQVGIMENEPEVGAIFTDFVRFSATGGYADSQFTFYPELARVPSVPTRCGNGKRITGDPFLELIKFSVFPTWLQTMLFRANSVKNIYFPPVRRATDDLHYCFRVFARALVAYIAEPLVEVRRHDHNYTRDLDLLEHEVRETLCELESEIREPARLSALRLRIGRAWSNSGDIYCRQGDLLGGLDAYMRALTCPGARLGALKRCLKLPLALLARPQRVTSNQRPSNLDGDLLDEAYMIRHPDGTIRGWDEGAKRLYGWDSRETTGKRSHYLLDTVFPAPLSAIETEFRQNGLWQGELIHKRRNGTRIVVRSTWHLLRSGGTKNPVVIEVNREKG